MMKRSNGIVPPATIMILVVVVVVLVTATSANKSRLHPPIALPNCPDRCGNISIPYPFGIGPDCFLNHWYNVTCNFTSGLPFLAALILNYSFSGDGLSISLPFQITLINTTATPLPSLVVDGPREWVGNEQLSYTHLDMRGSPFLLMPLLNTLVVIGCGGSGIIGNINSQSVIGCTTVCPDNATAQAIEDGFSWKSTKPLSQILGTSSSTMGCYGMGCCQTSLPYSLDYFNLKFQTFDQRSLSNTTTSSGAMISLVSTSYFTNLANSSSTSYKMTADEFYNGATAILQWRLQELPHNFPNRTSAQCANDTQQGGYHCYCKYDYYEGNPYLPQGCQVIEACEQCPDSCSLLNGAYGCLTIDHKKSAVPIALGLGISLGSISLSIIFYGLFRFLKVRKEIRQKQSNFKKNGGLLLQQQMSANEGAFERTKVFTCNELEKATDNFNENRILGHGGQGTVYKGMLLDGTIVAVKKSTKVDGGQLGQFINELVILSQVVHRNVVKLFGCCLETEVPLLVYEFVPNGTLFQHIHNPREDFYITWKMRLQIAIELAEALTYLHSSSFVPIYHRDIKTSNILLDDRYKAKLSDFGISKTVSIDQTHVTTNIQGTFGYIDPEYFQSNQFTEKSDVYSFGIVLLELLSSKKPVYVDKSTDTRSLASEFLLCMQQFRLRDIVDVDVLKVAHVEELEGVADLAKRCLNLNGNNRPTMREVVMTLQMINSENGVPHSSLEQIVIGKDHTSLVDEGPSSIPPPPTLSEESCIYTQSLLFEENSDL